MARENMMEVLNVKPVDDIQAVALDFNGKTVATIDKRGDVRLMTSDTTDDIPVAIWLQREEFIRLVEAYTKHMEPKVKEALAKKAKEAEE